MPAATPNPSDWNPDILNAAMGELKKADTEIAPLGPDQKRTPFPSVLSEQMNREQEDALVAWCKKEFTDLDQETGRSATDISESEYGNEWYSANSNTDETTRTKALNSFFGKRQIYELTWQNKLAWRQGMLGGDGQPTIFRQSNLTLETSRRITNQRIARFVRYFFEPRPWFSIQPVGGLGDKIFARKLLKFSDSKLYDSGSANQMRQAVIRACVLGECVLETLNAVDDDYYQEEVECLVDVNGEPIIAADGDYILRDDTWIPKPLDPLAAADQAMSAPMNPETGVPVPVSPVDSAIPPVLGAPEIPVEVLARDMKTEKYGNDITTPAGTFKLSQIELRTVDRRVIHYQGARCKVVYYRDILVPLSAESLDTARCVVRLQKLNVSDLAAQYAKNASAETLRQAVDAINAARTEGNSGNTMTAADAERARPAYGEDPATRAPSVAKLNTGTFYLFCDPAGSGITRDVMVVMDLDTWTPVYYNYTATASPTRRRPFKVVTACPVDGRWYGQGDMERFELGSNLIDLVLNRAALTQSRAGRVDFWRPHRTLEGQRNPNLVMNYGGTYTIAGDHKAEEVLESIYLQDNKSMELHKTLDYLNQAITNASGTASANDSEAAGLNTSATATGINNIARAGNELTALPISELRVGLEAALFDFIFVGYRYLDETESFTYHEGEVPVEMKLTRREVQNLRFNVTISLTAFAYDTERQKKIDGLAMANDYWDRSATDPERGIALAPMYTDGLTAMGFENAQDFIRPRMTTMVDPATGQPVPAPMPQAPPGSNPQPPEPSPATEPKTPSPV